VVIYEEDGSIRQYWRAEDEGGDVAWREQAPPAGQTAAGERMTSAELLKAIEASVLERRRASRGRKFRL